MNEKSVWKFVWHQPLFKQKVFLILGLNMLMIIFFPAFFQHIEKRNGVVLHDVLLEHIKPLNISIYIFIIIWCTVVLIIIRAVQQPEIFITFLFSFFLLSISRVITISLVPLNPPQHLVPLADPLTDIFYGNVFITKDLFYSGHVATQFLIFLCLKKKTDKIIIAITTTLIAAFVLIQHIHYTIDVIAAPFFAFACFLAGRYMAKNGVIFKPISQNKV